MSSPCGEDEPAGQGGGGSRGEGRRREGRRRRRMERTRAKWREEEGKRVGRRCNAFSQERREKEEVNKGRGEEKGVTSP